MNSNVLFGQFHLLLWAASIPLLPYTFLRKRAWFESAVVLFAWETITAMITTTNFPPNNWVGW